MKTQFFKYPFVLLASVATIIAGILHATIVAYDHAGIPPEFWFFVVTGVMQIAWGINFFYHRTSNMYFVGSVLNLGLTFFWLSARLLPAPFADAPESIEVLGIVTAIIQIVAFGATFWALYRFHRTTITSVFLLVLLSVVLGGIGYASAKVSEGLLLQMWPEIEEAAHGHGEETEDDHDDDEEEPDDHDDEESDDSADEADHDDTTS